MAWDTAADVINDVLAEAALGDSVAEPYTSSAAIVIQLRGLLKATGRELLRGHPWAHLQAEHTFPTVAGTAEYDLPAGFARVINTTAWNRTEETQMLGPVGAEGWQTLKALSVSGTVSYWWRVVGNKIKVHPTPTAVVTVAFEYVSRYWVQPSGQSTPTSETPSAGTDTLWFDPYLLTRALKVRLLEAKGFDTAAARMDYERAWEMATGGDGVSPVLSLTSPGYLSHRLLTSDNVPETGFGD